MAFYLVVKGRLTPYQFQYLDNKTPIRLEKTLSHGEPKPRENTVVPGEVFAIEVMTSKLITLSPAARIKEAAALMHAHKIHHIPLTIDRLLTGVISSRDIPENLIGAEKEIRLDKVMSKIVLAASESTPLRHVAEVFLKENINCLPIVDDSYFVTGIITHRDMIRWLLKNQKFTK